jgi:HK97 family phage major capsid protein
MTVKTPGEILAENIEKSVAVAEKNAEAIAKLAEATSSLVEKTAKDEEISKSVAELSELKAEVEVLKARDAARSKGDAGSSKEEAQIEKAKEGLKTIASAIISKAKAGSEKAASLKETGLYNEIGLLNKSIVTFDNTSAGAAVPAKRTIGTVNINAQTVSPITSLITNINAGAIVAGELGYRTYDPSLLRITGSNENAAKTTSEQVKNSEVLIHVDQRSAKMPISDKTLHAAMAGEFTFNPINQNLVELEKRYEKQIARDVLNGDGSDGIYGLIAESQKSGFRGFVVESANDNYVTLQDLGRLAGRLKSMYLRNAAIIVDRAVLDDIFYDEADDGHLRIEQFAFDNGISALRTPHGVFPLIGVDSSCLDADVDSNDGFANYKSYKSSSTLLSGYTPKAGSPSSGTDNAGKLAAVIGDLSSAYTLARSSVVQMGVDESISNILTQGYTWAGKIGYVGGKVVNQESFGVLYVK